MSRAAGHVQPLNTCAAAHSSRESLFFVDFAPDLVDPERRALLA
jgi:hypothetical protein